MKKIDVLIFGGQSNMQGQTECLSETEVVEGAYEYKWLTDEVIPLSNPVGENVRFDGMRDCITAQQLSKKPLVEVLETYVLLASWCENTNLVPSFCRAYLSRIKGEDKKVLAVHTAKGSTRIDEWLPGTKGYRALLEKSMAAIEKIKENYEIAHIFFIWLQGESDAIAGVRKQEYKEKLGLLNEALRTDLCIQKFGIIRVGRFTNDDRDWEIINAQNEMCEEQTEFLMLTDIATQLNRKSEYMNPTVAGHYSARGLEVLGTEAGKALGIYKANTER